MTRKHVWRGGGWRRHVISWGLRFDTELHRVVGFRRCSESDCELNAEKIRSHER